MNATLEQRLDSLTQMVETLVGAVNKNETSVKAAAPLPDAAIGRARKSAFEMTTNLSDYDLSAAEHFYNCRVMEIIEPMRNPQMKPDGSLSGLAKVRFEDGNKKLVKAIFKKGGPGTSQALTWVALSQNLSDYDFESCRQLKLKEGKVAKIVSLKADKAAIDGDGNGQAKMTVELSDGKIREIWVPIASGHKLKILQGPASIATTPQNSPATANVNEDFTAASAAVNLERLAARTPALKSFYAFTHAKGAAYCHGVLKPLLAKDPFPAVASVGAKISHMRGLLAKHIAPQVAKLAPGQTAEAEIEQAAETLVPGTREAWNADAAARHEYPSFAAYSALHAAGNPVLAEQRKLEREARQPRLVAGEWTLGEIGAHEREWLASPALQQEFPSAKCYGAYRRRGGK